MFMSENPEKDAKLAPISPPETTDVSSVYSDSDTISPHWKLSTASMLAAAPKANVLLQDMTGTFLWTPTNTPSVSVTTTYDAGLWTTSTSSFSQTQVSGTGTILQPSATEIYSTPTSYSPLSSSPYLMSSSSSSVSSPPTWSSSFRKSTVATSKTSLLIGSGSSSFSNTVMTKTFVTSTTSIGINASTTTVSISTGPKSIGLAPDSTSTLGSGVGWKEWTPGHRAGLVMSTFFGVFTVAVLLFLMWRMHRERRFERVTAHDVEGSEKESDVPQIAGGSRGGTGAREVSNIDKGTSTKSRDSIYHPASENYNPDPAGSGPTQSSQSTGSSSSSGSSSPAASPSSFGPTNDLETTVETSDTFIPSPGHNLVFAQPLERFQLPELPNAHEETPSPTSTSTSSDCTLIAEAEAHRRAAYNRRRQSRAVGVPANVQRRYPTLGRTRSGTMLSVPIWGHRVLEEPVLASTALQEPVRYNHPAGESAQTYGTLQERAAGKYPARWG